MSKGQLADRILVRLKLCKTVEEARGIREELPEMAAWFRKEPVKATKLLARALLEEFLGDGAPPLAGTATTTEGQGK